jgi:putative ABC transport system substrate-binding protein
MLNNKPSVSYKAKAILLGVFSLFFIGYSSLTASHSDKAAKTVTVSDKKNVMIIQNVEHPALNATRQGILDELKGDNLNIVFDSAQGNPTLALQIAQKFVGSAPNVMVGIGTTSTQALMAANQQQSIPIVFSSVTDPKGAKLVANLKKPEDSITGVSNFVEPGVQFDVFKKILPDLTKIGIIYSPGEPNSIALNDQMKKVAAQKGLSLVFVAANTSADVPQAAQSLATKKVQAIFINNDNVALSAFDSIVKIATERRIPTFCSDTDMVKRGALAALGPNQYMIGKQTGKIIRKILAGEKIENLPVLYPEKTELLLNVKQATALGINIPESLLSEAAEIVR